VRVVERRLRAEAVNIPLTVSDTDGKRERGRSRGRVYFEEQKRKYMI
jgi:hypothetical protein